MDLGLKGKTAIVTGGSKGIGRAVALALACEGADVSICARGLEELEAAASEIQAETGRRILPVQADMNDPTAIKRMVDVTVNELGGVDFLINNAVNSSAAPFMELTDEQWMNHINVKVMGYIRCSREVLPHMVQRGGGRIIMIGGMAARRPGRLTNSNGVTNSAVSNLAKNLSDQFAPQGILVNCIHPGATKTPRLAELMARRARDAGIDVEEEERREALATPIGRMILPEEVADLVLFFVSDHAAAITGQTIAIDGGSAQGVFYSTRFRPVHYRWTPEGYRLLERTWAANGWMKTIRRFLAPILLTLAVLSYAACASDEPTLPAAIDTAAPAKGVTVQIISTDLSVGRNRVAFALLNESGGVVSTPNVRVSATAPGADGTPSQETRATFRKWPLGDLGIYTAQLDFSTAGAWGLSVSIMGWGGVDGSGDGILEVKAKSATPSIGSPAPASRNKTINDVESLEQLTTANPPDPDLYRLTIADALVLGKPLVVVFATPAYCKTATCGPQLGEIGTLKERFQSQAAFIHVEVFDNPHLIQGDLERAIAVPATKEWGLLTEPWTFVVDSNGAVVAKFEAFTTAQEIEEDLVPLLN